MTIKSIGHTPGPWERDGDDIGREILVDGEPVFLPVCTLGQPTLYNTSDSFLEIEANAEFIVRACNSHEDLLVACEMVIHNTLKPEIWIQIVADAIAKAKGTK